MTVEELKDLALKYGYTYLTFEQHSDSYTLLLHFGGHGKTDRSWYFFKHHVERKCPIGWRYVCLLDN